MAALLSFLSKTFWDRLSDPMWSLSPLLPKHCVPTTTQALRKIADNPGGIYYASAPEVVPQCTIKSLPLGRKPDELIPPYQEPFVPLSQCPSVRNRLNIQAFQTAQYPITRNLYVVVKQNDQIDEQAGEIYANFLLTPQGQELIAQTGFVKIR